MRPTRGRQQLAGGPPFLLDVPQDWPLLFSGAIAIPLILRKNRRGLATPVSA